jgi:hypothetical protein
MKQKFSALKRRAKSRDLPVTISYQQFLNLKNGDCHYCGVESLLLEFYCEVMEINTPWMTIDRKDNKRGYTPENTVTSCYVCNRIKSNFFTYEEMVGIGKEYVAPKMAKFKDEAWDAYGEWCDQNVFDPSDWDEWYEDY